MTHETERLGGWVRRFLIEHLVVERNLSRNTQRSYRDTFQLLIPFATEVHKTTVERLAVAEVSAELVRRFLRHIEEHRRCRVRTRNQRLAAIHAFATFVGERCPELIPWCGEVRAVPFKRYDRPGLCYLDKPEVDALLAAPDRSTEIGRRDHSVLLLLYNTGARASEAVAVTVGDLDVRPGPTDPARCGWWAKVARRDTARSGRRRQRHCGRSRRDGRWTSRCSATDRAKLSRGLSSAPPSSGMSNRPLWRAHRWREKRSART